MRGVMVVAALLSLLAVPALAQSASERTVLVKLRPGHAATVMDAIAEKVGGKVARRFTHVGWQEISLPANTRAHDMVLRARGMREVAAAEVNNTFRTAAVANDPRLRFQWGLTTIGAATAWNTTTGSQSVVVAVIDSGALLTHEDLRANLWTNPGEVVNGRDDDGNGYVDDIHGINAITGDGTPSDDLGHGTHVAGIIGAAGNNGLGVTGVNWAVKIMPLKFLRAGAPGSTADALESYNYLIAMRKRGVNVRVANNSWVGTSYSQALADAITAAGNLGVLSIAAAGNGDANQVGLDIGRVPYYPAAYTLPALLSVAASDQQDNPASFSNYSGTKVGLAAPGVGILSTYASSDASYALMDGTSMAAPHVAGAAALLLARAPQLTPSALKTALLTTVDVLPQWKGRVSSSGRMNLARALASVGPQPAPAPTPATGALSAVALTVNPATQGRIYGLVTLTATPTGGPAEYRFVAVYHTSRGTNTLLLRDYRDTSSLIWRPYASGTYTLIVYARTPGSTAPYQVQASQSFTVMP